MAFPASVERSPLEIVLQLNGKRYTVRYLTPSGTGGELGELKNSFSWPKARIKEKLAHQGNAIALQPSTVRGEQAYAFSFKRRYSLPAPNICYPALRHRIPTLTAAARKIPMDDLKPAEEIALELGLARQTVHI